MNKPGTIEVVANKELSSAGAVLKPYKLQQECFKIEVAQNTKDLNESSSSANTRPETIYKKTVLKKKSSIEKMETEEIGDGGLNQKISKISHNNFLIHPKSSKNKSESADAKKDLKLLTLKPKDTKVMIKANSETSKASSSLDITKIKKNNVAPTSAKNVEKPQIFKQKLSIENNQTNLNVTKKVSTPSSNFNEERPLKIPTPKTNKMPVSSQEKQISGESEVAKAQNTSQNLAQPSSKQNKSKSVGHNSQHTTSSNKNKSDYELNNTMLLKEEQFKKNLITHTQIKDKEYKETLMKNYNEFEKKIRKKQDIVESHFQGKSEDNNQINEENEAPPTSNNQAEESFEIDGETLNPSVHENENQDDHSQNKSSLNQQQTDISTLLKRELSNENLRKSKSNPNEFMKKINKLRKQLKKSEHEDSRSNSRRSKQQSEPEQEESKVNINDQEIEDSLGKEEGSATEKYEGQDPEIVQVDYKTQHVYDQEGNFLYSSKKNLRTKDEIQNYMKVKRLKEKIIKEKKLRDEGIEKQKKFEYYNMFDNKVRSQSLQSSKNNSKNNSKINTNKSKSTDRKYEKNEYYRGCKSNLNDSSIIDAEDYYISIYELKNILTNNNGHSLSLNKKSLSVANPEPSNNATNLATDEGKEEHNTHEIIRSAPKIEKKETAPVKVNNFITQSPKSNKGGAKPNNYALQNNTGLNLHAQKKEEPKVVKHTFVQPQIQKEEESMSEKSLPKKAAISSHDESDYKEQMKVFNATLKAQLTDFKKNEILSLKSTDRNYDQEAPISSPDIEEHIENTSERTNNIIVSKDQEESARPSPKRDETKKKIEDIINKSRSRDLTNSMNNPSKNVSNSRIIQTEENLSQNPAHKKGESVMDDRDQSQSGVPGQFNNGTDQNDGQQLKDESELYPEEHEGEDGYVDFDNLDHDTAATFLQCYFKQIYMLSIQMSQNEILNQLEENPKEDNTHATSDENNIQEFENENENENERGNSEEERTNLEGLNMGEKTISQEMNNYTNESINKDINNHEHKKNSQNSAAPYIEPEEENLSEQIDEVSDERYGEVLHSDGKNNKMINDNDIQSPNAHQNNSQYDFENNQDSKHHTLEKEYHENEREDKPVDVEEHSNHDQSQNDSKKYLQDLSYHSNFENENNQNDQEINNTEDRKDHQYDNSNHSYYEEEEIESEQIKYYQQDNNNDQSNNSGMIDNAERRPEENDNDISTNPERAAKYQEEDQANFRSNIYEENNNLVDASADLAPVDIPVIKSVDITEEKSHHLSREDTPIKEDPFFTDSIDRTQRSDKVNEYIHYESVEKITDNCQEFDKDDHNEIDNHEEEYKKQEDKDNDSNYGCDAPPIDSNSMPKDTLESQHINVSYDKYDNFQPDDEVDENDDQNKNDIVGEINKSLQNLDNEDYKNPHSLNENERSSEFDTKVNDPELHHSNSLILNIGDDDKQTSIKENNPLISSKDKSLSVDQPNKEEIEEDRINCSGLEGLLLSKNSLEENEELINEINKISEGRSAVPEPEMKNQPENEEPLLDELMIEHMTNEILKELLQSEINDTQNLLPTKSFNRDINSSAQSPDFSYSRISERSYTSVRTVQEERIEISNKLYESTVCPELLKKIENEVKSSKFFK